MRNHTTPRVYELTGNLGKNPTLTAGSAPVAAQYYLSSLPFGKEGKFWNYATAIWLRCAVNFDTGTSAINMTAADFYNVLQSVQVQTPLLGNLFAHSNTRGTVLGNLIQYIGMGYNQLPQRQPVSSILSGSTYVFYVRIPFSYEFLRKPHETSPWVGFLEGGTVDVRVDVAGSLDYVVASNNVNSVALRCWVEMIPAPEAVIHTPAHWREHIVPSGTKHTITDMGSPDGLQGIDQSKGVGLAFLANLMNVYQLTSGQSTITANNISSFDVPWRYQDRIDATDALLCSLYTQMGVRPKNELLFTSTTITDFGGWPNTANGSITTGGLADNETMIFPLVAPGRDQETSKLQTVAGAKDVNYTYSSAPTGNEHYLGCYFPQFDEQFAASLAARIAPNSAGKLVAKTLNKQAGGIPGVGKLAYVRQKVAG